MPIYDPESCVEHFDITFCPGCQSEPPVKDTCYYCDSDCLKPELCHECEEGYDGTNPRPITEWTCPQYARSLGFTCLAPPKWRGSDGKCNSCLVCAPEKFKEK